MSESYYITLEQNLDEIDIMPAGKALAKMMERIDEITDDIGVTAEILLPGGMADDRMRTGAALGIEPGGLQFVTVISDSLGMEAIYIITKRG